MPRPKTQAQQPPTTAAGGGKEYDCPPQPAMSPRLLRRLSEAALGHPVKGEQWWVSRIERDPKTLRYHPDGPHPTREKAEKALKGRSGFGVFGPYELTASEMAAAKKPPPVRIKSITVETTDGQVLYVDVEQFDAIFWRSPSVEKFVLPYYTSSSGVDYAARVNKDWFGNTVYMLAHSDDTEYNVYAAKRTPDGIVQPLAPID